MYLVQGPPLPITVNDLATNWPESSLSSPPTSKVWGPKEGPTQHYAGVGGKVQTGSLSFHMIHGPLSLLITPSVCPNLQSSPCAMHLAGLGLHAHSMLA